MSDIENFSFLIEGELAGMAYPHAPRAMEELARRGFRSVVSLSRRAPTLGALGSLIHLHCPLSDFMRIPSVDLQRVVAFLSCAPRPVRESSSSLSTSIPSWLFKSNWTQMSISRAAWSSCAEVLPDNNAPPSKRSSKPHPSPFF